MNPVRLLMPDQSLADAWACEKCKRPWTDELTAIRCCLPEVCPKCGAASRYRNLCQTCYVASQKAEEAKEFAKAEKLAAWDGWVWTSESDHENGFFESVKELVDYFTEYEGRVPAYAWICEPHTIVNLSIDDILETIEQDENAYEDFSTSSLKGIDDLDIAINEFNEANIKEVSHQTNKAKAVLIPQATGGALKD